jgi:hypothetical protein
VKVNAAIAEIAEWFIADRRDDSAISAISVSRSVFYVLHFAFGVFHFPFYVSWIPRQRLTSV